MEYKIDGFGEERSNMNYSGVSVLICAPLIANHELMVIISQLGDWIFTYMHPYDYWKAHPSYVICEIDFIVGAALMITHGQSVDVFSFNSIYTLYTLSRFTLICLV